MLLLGALHVAVMPASAAPLLALVVLPLVALPLAMPLELLPLALPFLPAGKGALILILGGLAMLPASLLWSRLTAPPWTGGVERDAPRLGLGPCRVLSRSRERCVVALGSCPTCRQGIPGPCERERRALQLAIHARAPQAHVVEVSCNGSRQGALKGACVFEIRRGRDA